DRHGPVDAASDSNVELCVRAHCRYREQDRNARSECRSHPACRYVIVSSGHQILCVFSSIFEFRSRASRGDFGRAAAALHSSGTKSMMRLRSNSDGTDGSGRGDARRTASSIDRITASSPLQLVTRALMTSPLGICVTCTVQLMPGRALAGRLQFCSILFVKSVRYSSSAPP